MSGRDGLTSEVEALKPAGPTAEPHAAAKKIDGSSAEDCEEVTDDLEDLKEKGQEEEEEEEEEMSRSAHLEPSTLPWPGDRRPQTDEYDGSVSEPGEGDTGTGGGRQDLQEEQSRAESDRRAKAKWRESMPEGERWRDDDTEMQKDDKGDGSLADDEEEDEEEEKEESYWISEKAAMGFTPQVTIVRPSCKETPGDEESSVFIERDEKEEVQVEPDSAGQFYPEWREQDDNCYLCEHLCREKLKVVLAAVAAGILFPLLVWGGYALLPFDSPLLVGAPLRVVYTLRCSFFAVIPILLGMVVLGIVRLRHNNLRPLHQSKLANREVAAQWHYVNESMSLFLFFFVQLAVMATYVSQDLMKLVPLLTIVFVFGRLFYWLCISLGNSSIRSFGFGLSFLPILVMMGTNLYFVCSSVGQGAIFDVAPPTTPPPPRMRWWF